MFVGSKSPKKSTISLPCGSPGRPCPHKMSKSSRGASVSSSRKSNAGSICSKSCGSGFSSAQSEVSSATKSKSSCSSGFSSPDSSPSCMIQNHVICCLFLYGILFCS